MDPVTGALIGTGIQGIMSWLGGDKQADAISDASQQAFSQTQQGMEMQREMQEKSLLAQLYLASLGMQQTQEAQQLELDKEQRALEAVEPYRRVGYGAIPYLQDLFQESFTPIPSGKAEVPPELKAMFGLEQEDLTKQVNRQQAARGFYGSPIGVSNLADQYRRLQADQTARGYTAGLAAEQQAYNRATAEDARKWGRAGEMVNIGQGLGTSGYGLAGNQLGSLASQYSNLGSNVGNTLGNIGQGYQQGYNNLANLSTSTGTAQANSLAGKYSNFGNQLGSLASIFGYGTGNQFPKNDGYTVYDTGYR